MIVIIMIVIGNTINRQSAPPGRRYDNYNDYT